MIGLALALLVVGPVDGLQQADALAQSVGWRLATANAPYCARVVPATGIMLADTATFDDPALVRSAYGLTGDIFIGALAAGAPGERTSLAVNATVTAIDDLSLATIAPPPRRDPFARLFAAQALLDRGAAHRLTLADGRTVEVIGVPACHVAIMVDDSRNQASAQRDTIHLGRTLLDEVHGDVDLIAALIAHEMAHAVLDHQAQLTAGRGATAVIRRTEREADRLSVWLLANAGFPAQAAVDLQATISARHAGIVRFDPLHGSWRQRIASITAEIAALHAAPDANWAKRFVREKN